MKVTIVTIKAFERTITEHFIDKNFEQIHAELFEKCNTYEVVSILQATGAQFQPIYCLTKFKTND